MNRDLEGSGHRDHAHGQLTVPDGDPLLGRPGGGASAKHPGCLTAQPRDRAVRLRLGSATEPRLHRRFRAIAACSTPIESLTWSSNIARFQPAQGVGPFRSGGVASAAAASA